MDIGEVCARRTATHHTTTFTLKKIFTHCWLPGSRAKVFAQKLGFSESQILTGLYSSNQNIPTLAVDSIPKGLFDAS